MSYKNNSNSDSEEENVLEDNIDNVEYSLQSNESEDDDAPLEINFSSSKKISIELAEKQKKFLNKIKQDQQEKRKLIQERNIEQKKNKNSFKTLNLAKKTSEEFIPIKSLIKETPTSKLSFVLNDSDQIEKMNINCIKKYKDLENKIFSFKDKAILKNKKVKRIKSSDVINFLHKKQFKI